MSLYSELIDLGVDSSFADAVAFAGGAAGGVATPKPASVPKVPKIKAPKAPKLPKSPKAPHVAIHVHAPKQPSPPKPSHAQVKMTRAIAKQQSFDKAHGITVNPQNGQVFQNGQFQMAYRSTATSTQPKLAGATYLSPTAAAQPTWWNGLTSALTTLEQNNYDPTKLSTENKQSLLDWWHGNYGDGSPGLVQGDYSNMQQPYAASTTGFIGNPIYPSGTKRSMINKMMGPHVKNKDGGTDWKTPPWMLAIGAPLQEVSTGH